MTGVAPYGGQGRGEGQVAGDGPARDGAREPAPGEADPLAEDHQRDRRADVWGMFRRGEDGWSDTS